MTFALQVRARLHSAKENLHNKPYAPLVIDLFVAVVSFVIKPINEDRSMENARAIVAPSFKASMCFG